MPENLTDLREQVEAAQLRAQLKSIETAMRMADLATSHVGTLREGWGDMVDRTEYLRDGYGLSNFGELSGRLPSQASDRRDGDNMPFWSSETELAQIRGVARFLAMTDEVAIGAADNLTNYVIGTGFGYKVQARDASDVNAAALAARVQRLVDRILEANDWPCAGEREAFVKSRRDGEVFVGLEHRGGPNVEFVPLDPGAVTEPDNPRDLEAYARMPDVPTSWKFGIATPSNRTHRPMAYFVEWASGFGQDWDLFPVSRVMHVRLNVDREIKRGVSDYYAVWRNLERAGKLLGNSLEGAAVQAAIAFIREHAAGVTTDTIQDLVAARADVKRTDPRTGKQRNVAQMKPGTIVDVTAGMKYQSGPMGGTNIPQFVQIIQAGLRTTGIRWTMPEYMISGDASNANFSSTLVSESPFVKATESRQAVYTAAYRRLVWQAVQLVARCSAVLGAGVTPELLDEVLELVVDAPQVAVRNKVEDHQIRKEEYDAGLLSLDTWATEAGRDLAQERRLGAKAQPKPVSPFGPPTLPMPGQSVPPQPQPPTREQVRSSIVDAVIDRVWEAYP